MSVLLVKAGKQLAENITESLAEINESVLYVAEYDQAIEEIRTNRFDSILIPYKSGDAEFSGFIKKVRNIKNSFPGIIILSGKDDLKNILQEQTDFDDFILKPFTKDELLIRINSMKQFTRLKSQSFISKKNMLKLAKEDPSTGFLNRRSILDEALKEMNRSSRDKKFLSSIMVSITNLKEVTEGLDNRTIENIYFEFSRRLFKSCRPYDKIGRYGISEFLVLLPDASVEEAEKVAKRLIATLAVKNIRIGKLKINLELNIGISQLDPDDIARTGHADDNLMNDLILDALIKRTEIAMNDAVKKGPNSIVKYHI